MKKILITGAGSGFGQGAALGLAKKGYTVIAGVQIWPQVTTMRKEAEVLGLTNLRVEKLDILDAYDVANALTWDIDILVNNAAIGYSGPISEIPLTLMRANFETNIFAALNLTQQIVRKWVNAKHSGKIVFVSSMAGLTTAAGFGSYCATKHALECIAESLQDELKAYAIQVQTINPGPYLTGFNDTMAESAYHWMNDTKNFHQRADMKEVFAQVLDRQMDPQEVINAMIELIPADVGKFRNVIPQAAEAYLKQAQEAAWQKEL